MKQNNLIFAIDNRLMPLRFLFFPIETSSHFVAQVASNSRSSCLSFPSSRITGMCHDAWVGLTSFYTFVGDKTSTERCTNVTVTLALLKARCLYLPPYPTASKCSGNKEQDRISQET
jgi:hypothetical protein